MLDKYRPCFLRGTQTPEHRHTPPQNCGVLVNWHLPMNLIGRTSHELESIFWQRKKGFQVGTSNQTNAEPRTWFLLQPHTPFIIPVGAAHLSGWPRWRELFPEWETPSLLSRWLTCNWTFQREPPKSMLAPPHNRWSVTKTAFCES